MARKRTGSLFPPKPMKRQASSTKPLFAFFAAARAATAFKKVVSQMTYQPRVRSLLTYLSARDFDRLQCTSRMFSHGGRNDKKRSLAEQAVQDMVTRAQIGRGGKKLRRKGETWGQLLRYCQLMLKLKKERAERRRQLSGFSHTVSLSDNGEVYTFGENKHGECGHGDCEPRTEPTLVEGLKDHHVTAIACGFHHTLALTSEGRLFSFGYGGFGALGHNGKDNELLPREVTALVGRRVVSISSGSFFSLCLTSKGRVFSFGDGDHGRLGHGGWSKKLRPRLVRRELGRKRVVEIAAGEGHAVALTDDGEVFTWGAGYWGQLGHGSTDSQLVPRRVEGLVGNGKAVSIEAFDGHTRVAMDTGDLFSFGSAPGSPTRQRQMVARLRQAPSMCGAIAGGGHSCPRCGQPHAAGVTVCDACFEQLDNDPTPGPEREGGEHKEETEHSEEDDGCNSHDDDSHDDSHSEISDDHHHERHQPLRRTRSARALLPTANEAAMGVRGWPVGRVHFFPTKVQPESLLDEDDNH